MYTKMYSFSISLNFYETYSVLCCCTPLRHIKSYCLTVGHCEECKNAALYRNLLTPHFWTRKRATHVFLKFVLCFLIGKSSINRFP